MARPSNTVERRHDILSAYVSAVALHGVSGATLQAVADQAALARPLVRHHLGNKDQMFDALVDHVVAQFDAQTQHMIAALPPSGRVAALVDLLFSAQAETDAELVLVFAELTAASASYAGVAQRLARSVAGFEQAVLHEISMDYPTAHPTTQQAVAHGVMALYFNITSLAPLGMSSDGARRAAKLLITTLITESA